MGNEQSRPPTQWIESMDRSLLTDILNRCRKMMSGRDLGSASWEDFVMKTLVQIQTLDRWAELKNQDVSKENFINLVVSGCKSNAYNYRIQNVNKGDALHDTVKHSSDDDNGNEQASVDQLESGQYTREQLVDALELLYEGVVEEFGAESLRTQIFVLAAYRGYTRQEVVKVFDGSIPNTTIYENYKKVQAFCQQFVG